jgi:hypothetical protein
MRGLGRAGVALVAMALLAGCGGEKGTDSASAVPCDDAAFRGQDEELYVVQATITNAIGGGGDPATLLLDLRRGRTALAEYLEAHPPCDDALKEIAAAEKQAVAALDEATAALDEGSDAAAPLARALEMLESAQGALASSR